MQILICSDGTDPADLPARLGGLVASACGAGTTLLGIAETPGEDGALRAALASEAAGLEARGLHPQVQLLNGDPVPQILAQTSAHRYDLVVIGGRAKRSSGLYWRAERTYEIIKSIPPPVLVAIAACESIKSFLVCTGGKKYIEDAVQLTGMIAKSLGAKVTLLHVMAEPPAIFADLVRLEEDVEGLLTSGSELGRNLSAQRQSLEKIGVPAEIRVRHGFVIDQVFNEVQAGGHDVIVTGSSQARGPLRHYIMGDLTRSIVNQASCPVLVARPGAAAISNAGIWQRLKNVFRAPEASPK